MPQSAVNMKVNMQNKDICNTENNRFKMRHAPYLNRYQQAEKRQNID